MDKSLDNDNNSDFNNEKQSMLSDTTSDLVMQNSSIPAWPVLEPALDRLFPLPATTESAATLPPPLSSEDYLKLYTCVFEHCVGAVKKPASGSSVSGLICGEDLYGTLVKYLENRLIQWSTISMSQLTDSQVFENILLQLQRIQAAEKPLIFIFTYLERHWIDRQINEQRIDVLPMKQLIWSLWDSLVLARVWTRILPVVSINLAAARRHEIPLEALEQSARFVHYLRVISKPSQLESDFAAGKRVIMAGAVVNPRVSHVNRFKDFVAWYCSESLHHDFPKCDSVDDFIQKTLQFWNDEEGRMVFLRFDKSAQVSVRNYMKSHLLVPNLEAICAAFHDSIMKWNCLAANAIYRLLANRKSLLGHLDAQLQQSMLLKGQELLIRGISTVSSDETENLFINLIGQFYGSCTDLIQTALAARPEMLEVRSRVFSQLLNDPPNFANRRGFAARSLAKFADLLIRNPLTEDSNQNSTNLQSALFRLINDKNEFQDTYGKLLALRLLTSGICFDSAKSSFETELMGSLKQICGAYFVASYERMFADVRERDSATSATILTGATWSIRGKLLPGHSLFLPESSSIPWPDPVIDSQVGEQTNRYYAQFPKRKLFWSPLLSCVEFNYIMDRKSSITIRATCVHLSILKSLASQQQSVSQLMATLPPSSTIALHSLKESGLIVIVDNKLKGEEGHMVSLNTNFTWDTPVLDLYTATLHELLFSDSSHSQHNYSSNASPIPKSFTPRPFSASSSSLNPSAAFASNSSHLTPLDKSILLQCAITRTMKQLRSLSLLDLFNRLSMLPKLLSRFSPSIEDILDALKQLHDKEFVKLAFGDLDDLVEAEQKDLENIHQNHQNLFIKYMA